MKASGYREDVHEIFWFWTFCPSVSASCLPWVSVCKVPTARMFFFTRVQKHGAKPSDRLPPLNHELKMGLSSPMK